MISKIVSFGELAEAGRWRADIFVHADELKVGGSEHPLRKLGDLVEEKVKAILPAVGDELTYIGLENVESVTGEWIRSRETLEVKSRSKVFTGGDILYGRLRPALRKVLLVPKDQERGICSTEFIVLRAKPSLISPIFLRELLASESISRKLERMQGGAALPRVSSKDLMELQLPIPPLDEQERIAKSLAKLKDERRKLRARIEEIRKDEEALIADLI